MVTYPPPPDKSIIQSGVDPRPDGRNDVFLGETVRCRVVASRLMNSGRMLMNVQFPRRRRYLSIHLFR